jgi:hypothetical protein
MLTAEVLREALHYDPLTGVFTWRKPHPRARCVKVGQRAGYVRPDGYVVIRVFESHLAHRLAWLYVHGVWPERFIDHRNEDRADNRIANLRDVTNAVNLQNQHHPQKNSTTGYRGVYRDRTGCFGARLKCRGVTYHLGTYATPEQAHVAYLTGKRTHHAIAVGEAT